MKAFVNLYENGSASWYRTEDEALKSILKNHNPIAVGVEIDVTAYNFNKKMKEQIKNKLKK